MANNSSLAVIKKKKREEERNSLTTYRKGIIAEKMPVFLVYIRALSSLIEVRSGRVFFYLPFPDFFGLQSFPSSFPRGISITGKFDSSVASHARPSAPAKNSIGAHAMFLFYFLFRSHIRYVLYVRIHSRFV